jgi:protein SCO1/2
MRRLAYLFYLLPLLLLTHPAWGHGTTATRADVGLEEKLGQYIAADADFVEENGTHVLLRDLIDKPTIIAPVYFGCTHECPLLLTGLARSLGGIDLMKPGKDYQVLTISFDEHDTPAIARDKKPNYLKAVGKPFPEDAWKFLTGDRVNIRRFTDSIGFKFQQDSEHDFSHPVTLVIVAPGGKIVRYIEGVTFLPFEVTMALTEASQGRVGATTRKVLMYCFSYDPLKKSYVFNILKVTGTVMVLFVGSFFAYLMMTTRKKKSP